MYLLLNLQVLIWTTVVKYFTVRRTQPKIVQHYSLHTWGTTVKTKKLYSMFFLN